MKGIGKEQAFTVSKRRNPARFQNPKEIPLNGLNAKKKTTAGDRNRYNRMDEYGGASQRDQRNTGPEGNNSYRLRDPDVGNSRNEESVTLNDEDYDHQSIDDSLED